MRFGEVRAMKTVSIITVLVCSVVLLIPGHAWSDETDEAYYPLKEGMRWEYNVTSDKGATKKLIITNLAPREVNDRKVTPRKWELGGTTFYELMYKDDTGIYRYAEQQAENAPPSILTPKECHLKFPVTKGNNWNMTTKLDGGPLTVNLSIDSVSEDVTVPAGSFKDCLKIRQAGENEAGASVLGYEWYAPKVGVVKSIVTIKKKSKEGAEVAEHRSYQLLSFKP